eukprot:augustus_masked-scaffold_3-processed-gene-9.55-mRNA-1 protein AED:0.28 eAED:1.00 QI:0/-1/0/1/-1/1/1/0/248
MQEIKNENGISPEELKRIRHRNAQKRYKERQKQNQQHIMRKLKLTEEKLAAVETKLVTKENKIKELQKQLARKDTELHNYKRRIQGVKNINDSDESLLNFKIFEEKEAEESPLFSSRAFSVNDAFAELYGSEVDLPDFSTFEKEDKVFSPNKDSDFFFDIAPAEVDPIHKSIEMKQPEKRSFFEEGLSNLYDKGSKILQDRNVQNLAKRVRRLNHQGDIRVVMADFNGYQPGVVDRLTNRFRAFFNVN